MIEPEFPEEMAYDSAGNCLGGIEKPRMAPSYPFADAGLDAQIQEIEEEHRQRRARLKYPFRLIQELSFKPAPKRWIVKGLLAKGETSAWIAPPGGMKSALMAELSVCAANQLPWHGRRVDSCFPVVYFALERADLVQRRLAAHCTRLNLSADDMAQMDIAICSSTIDLTSLTCVDDVKATLRSIMNAQSGPAGLLIFDTFAKLIAAGGKDENSAKDQGAVFANIQRIKDEAGNPHVALVGHTGKDETRGARGSNAILGDVDVMVEISGKEIKTATVTKANDMPEGSLFSFRSEVHDFGTDEDGDPITVNIVSSEGVLAQVAPKSSEPKLSGTNQKLLFRILHEAGADGLTLEEWNAQAHAAGITRKASLTEARYSLIDKNMVREYGGRWKVNHES
ncbi:AAA family ATPase [Bradyrhizobium sp. AUGA SZCCT0431]|uniref:AAA family ATPase n=1 Tax=Bradyrhizobium sp. AUGA SZCCT0431 TaxID=2807674 RepID=UPI001BA685A0|nr:AAA family ATPase [Bradyrhizobium sp. AUGA SZCCT0431]MBR1145087.1 AAA family ATPase [Bradyrhizobium sp. AUGA SZCCT0431]